MHLVTGGAYQGKLAFAREKYALEEKEISACTSEGEPDWSCRCIDHWERYILYCVKNDLPTEDKLRPDAIVICDDIFCGVVPMEPLQRRWREAAGRSLQQLACRAESVERVFCGIGKVLKE